MTLLGSLIAMCLALIRSLANTERREDSAQDIVGSDLAEDGAQRIERLAQFDREQLSAVCQTLSRAIQSRSGIFDRLDMPGVDRQRVSGCRAEGELVQPAAKLRHVLAGVCAHRQTRV